MNFKNLFPELRIEIKSLYFDLISIINLNPKIVILPYSYYLPKTWPYDFLFSYFSDDVKYISINWEQYLFPMAWSHKVPRPIGRDIYQCYWLPEYKDKLLSNGYSENQLIYTHDPHLQKYYGKMNFTSAHPIENYRKNYKHIVFCPVNFVWFFQNEKFVNFRVQNGLNPDDAAALIYDLKHQLDFWVETFHEVARLNPSIAFVLRPHPSVNPNLWKNIVLKNNLDNVFIDTSSTAEDWAIEADLTISNCSTVIYHSNVANLNAYILRATPLIEQLNADWLQTLPRLQKAEDIISALKKKAKGRSLKINVSEADDFLGALKNLNTLLDVPVEARPLITRAKSLLKFMFNKDFIKYLLLALRLYQKSSIERDRL